MRRAAPLLLALALTVALAGSARAGTPEWHSQQPIGPGGRTPLGEVGDIECWSANRCLLITGGKNGMPAGLYAYDGSGWYLYSTVCGGSKGRIAWVGPDEFWTISDQQRGQETEITPPQSISLCHFKDGAVVASYAEPVGVPTSYLPMDAAACLTAEECWFAGERLPGTLNVGAFHLYWTGLSLQAFPSLTLQEPELEDPGRSVVDLAYHQGVLYESVRAQAKDQAEEPEPYFLHRVLPGEPSAVVPEIPATPIEYGAGAKPTQLEGFRFGDDGEGLWAVSGASAAPAKVTALRLVEPEAGFEQIALQDPTHAFAPGDGVTGIAAEPGEAAVWVGFRHSSDLPATAPARLARVHADGAVEPALTLPVEGEGIGRKGPAGPIACGGPEQCWMATTEGWLFHLGPDPAPNTDPAMHVEIGFRPADASLPSVPPLGLPEDDSGANSESRETLPEAEPEPIIHRKPPLYSKLHSQLIGKYVLELTFVLHEKAHVLLLAKRKGAVVARTGRLTMSSGPRRVRLRLDPERWPTKLDLQVHPVKKGGGK
jgi:hypothetical protein